MAGVARKSLVAARELPVGTMLGPSDVAVKRPGTGLPPAELSRVLGCRVRRPLAEGDLLSWDALDAGEGGP